MEVVSLSVAVPGFIVDIVELNQHLQSAKSFQKEAPHVWILLKSNLTRLRIWEDKAGVKDGELTDDHDPALDDPDVLSGVRGHLQTARELSAKIEKALTRLSPEFSNPTAKRLRFPRLLISRIKWGFGRGKAICDDWGKLNEHVNKLYELVPTKPEKDYELKAMCSRFFMGKDINEWIQVDLVDQQFHIHRNAWLEGTGDWIFGHPAYQSWLSGVGGLKLLWLCGPAGSGKTVLSATVIRRLKEISPRGPPVIYYFSSVHTQTTTQLEGIIRSFISQLAHQSVHIREQIWKHVRSSRDGSDVASEGDLWAIFKGLLEGTPGCTLVIDGLDEFDGSNLARSKFLRHIKSTVQNTSTKVMVSSRDEGDIGDELLPAAHVCKISEDLVRSDIRRLAEALVFEKLSKRNEELKHELSERLIEKSGGMFLWIKQQDLQQLRGTQSDSELREIVDEMPSGLTDTYEKTWREITNRTKRDYHKILGMLRWAAFSFRPLTVVEMIEALLVHTESSRLFQERWPDEINEEYIQGEIKGLCGSLINIQASPEDPSSSTVHLAHASVKEFLLTKLDATLQDHHAELAKICLCYMNFSQVWKRDGNRIPYVFLDYAIHIWHKHFEAAMQQDSKTLELINSLLAPESPTFSSMRNYLIDTDTEISTDAKANRKKQPGNPLWFAAEWNMVEVAKYLLSTHPELLDAVEPDHATPLIRACARGYTDLVNLLIDNNADVELEIEGRSPALIQAVMGDHMDLVASLVARRLDMEVRDYLGRTAFVTACLSNHIKIAEFLLERGANQAVICNDGTTPLYWACWHGNLDLVRRVLGASRNLIGLRTRGGTTLLFASVNRNQLEIAEYLLKNGARESLEATCFGFTPLLNAAYEGHLNMFNLLVTYGANLHALSKTKQSTLHLASSRGAYEVAKVCLRKGVDPNLSEAEQGYTALHYAAQRSEHGLVQILLDHGANIDAKTADGYTPFLIAVENGCLEIAEYLATHKANASMEGPDGLTPLHIAAEYDHPSLIPFLLRHGAKLDSRSSVSKSTPLFTAVSRNNYAVTQALCEHGDVSQFSMTTEWGYFPLQFAVEQGFTSLVELLIKYGADPTFGGSRKMTPLYLAAKMGRDDIARILIHSQKDFSALCGSYWSPLNAGASGGHIQILEILAGEKKVTSFLPDCEGRSALHLAARGGHVSAFNFLLRAGLDPTLRDLRNRTVLHYAAASSSIEMVESVLQLSCISSILDEVTGWSILHWAAIAGSGQLVQLLISAGLPETCIMTDFPEKQTSWTPWNIAQFFNNQNLLSNADCPLRLQDDSPKIFPGTSSDIYDCDSCESRIFGPRYLCSTCDRSLDYCFMCMMDVENVHPGHKLKQADTLEEEG